MSFRLKVNKMDLEKLNLFKLISKEKIVSIFSQKQQKSTAMVIQMKEYKDIVYLNLRKQHSTEIQNLCTRRIINVFRQSKQEPLDHHSYTHDFSGFISA